MLILGYPRRLAVNQKEVKEVRTVAERLVTESGIPAEFPEETKRGVFLSILLGVVSTIAALLVAGLVYLFVEIGGNIVGIWFFRTTHDLVGVTDYHSHFISP